MKKVVIVEGEKSITKMLLEDIPWERWNCKVVACAEDAKKGQAAIMQHRPDMVFSEIVMPNGDGLKMLEEVKKQLPELEVCILTSERVFEAVQEALNLGVRRFLTKPFDRKKVEEAASVMAANVEKQCVYEEEQEEVCETVCCFVVKKAMEYMEEHYKRRLTLAEVAGEIYVSQWHLSKLLNKDTGHSFSDLLNRTRVLKAQELLKDKSLRIGEIAEMVGFLDMPHFSRVFKKITGISANEYRNKMC